MSAPRPPKDYPDPGLDLDPLDEPHPFDRIRDDVKIKIYIVLIVLVVIATAFGIWSRAEAQEAVPFAEDCKDAPADECQIYNQATVWTITGSTRELGWCEWPNDVATMDLFYRLEALEFPPKDPQVPVTTWEVPEGTTTQDWTPNRAGVFFFQIRACRTDIAQDGQPIPDDQDPSITYDPEQRADGSWMLCSIWNKSIFDQEGGGQVCGDPDGPRFPRGWIFNVTLAPATGGGIE